jgi:hypothetical protein
MFIIDHLKFFDLLSRIAVGVVVLALFPLFNGEVIKDAFHSPSVFTVLRRWMHSELWCKQRMVSSSRTRLCSIKPSLWISPQEKTNRAFKHSERCCYNKRPIIKGLNLHQQT